MATNLTKFESPIQNLHNPSDIKGKGAKNLILRRFLGLKLRPQGEGGGSRNPKLEETLSMDVPNPKFVSFNGIIERLDFQRAEVNE